MALILSRFASIPFVETKQSRTLPLVIPNIHFSRVNFSMFSHIFAKVSAKSEM
jgi:hypothetical protein